MCEAKPGPRCSADAKKSLNKAILAVGNAQTIADEAGRALVAAGNNYRQTSTGNALASVKVASQNYDLATANLKAVKSVRHDKQLEFYATPEGFKYLETASDEFSRITLKAAKEHREIQKALVSHIASFPDEEDKKEFIIKTRTMLSGEMYEKHIKLVGSNEENLNAEMFGHKISSDYLKFTIADLTDVLKTSAVNR